MSAPKTNLETQKRRHLAPLLGMALVTLFGVGLIVYWQFEEAANGASPGEDAPAELPEGTPQPAVTQQEAQPDAAAPQGPVEQPPPPEGE